jgi:hypothetical protein
MDQNSICFFLAARELNAHAVHIERESVLHENVVGCSTVTQYLCSARFREIDAVQGNDENGPDADFVDETILKVSAFQPFAFVPQISCMILVSKLTEYRRLMESLGVDRSCGEGFLTNNRTSRKKHRMGNSKKFCNHCSQ